MSRKTDKSTYERMVKRLHSEIVQLEKKPENEKVYQRLHKKMVKYTELWKRSK